MSDVTADPTAEKEVPPEEKYAQDSVAKDPNAPRNPEDPNDKIRAEGPEVADPATEAAHALFNENNPPADDAPPEDAPTS